jgi:hypothetical protein
VRARGSWLCLHSQVPSTFQLSKWIARSAVGPLSCCRIIIMTSYGGGAVWALMRMQIPSTDRADRPLARPTGVCAEAHFPIQTAALGRWQFRVSRRRRHYQKAGACMHVSISRGRWQKSTCHDPAMACAIITTHLAARIISSHGVGAHNNALGASE